MTFRSGLFFGDKSLTQKFTKEEIIEEQNLGMTTFMLALDLVFQDAPSDIAVYKLRESSEDIIRKIPYLGLDFSTFDFNTNKDLFCLQASPSQEFGRTLNKSCIEGVVDNFSYNLGKAAFGMRYLLKTYFRFGSSGAPYVFFDEQKQQFVINAIQSEACPIQMDVNGQRN